MKRIKPTKKQQLIQYILDNYKEVLRDKISRDMYDESEGEMLLNLTSGNSGSGSKQNNFITYILDILEISYDELKPFIGGNNHNVKHPLFLELLGGIMNEKIDKK